MIDNTQPAGAGEGGEAIADSSAPVATNEPAEATPSQTEQDNKPASDPREEELSKVRKALDRKNRDIGKKTAQYHQVKQELESIKQKLNQYEQKSPQASDSPQEKDFANYGEYLKAVARYEARQEYNQGQQKAKEDQSAAEKAQWKEERENHLRENAAQAREKIPEFAKTLADNQHLLEEFPPHVVDAFLESDHPAFAFHQMIEDGTIDQLLQAPTATKAAALIAKAEIAALAPKTKPVTKAPPPLSQTKGSATSGKQPVDMSGDELMAWLKS
jgi:hypothetical protein